MVSRIRAAMNSISSIGLTTLAAIIVVTYTARDQTLNRKCGDLEHVLEAISKKRIP